MSQATRFRQGNPVQNLYALEVLLDCLEARPEELWDESGAKAHSCADVVAVRAVTKRANREVVDTDMHAVPRHVDLSSTRARRPARQGVRAATLAGNPQATRQRPRGSQPRTRARRRSGTLRRAQTFGALAIGQVNTSLEVAAGVQRPQMFICADHEAPGCRFASSNHATMITNEK